MTTYAIIVAMRFLVLLLNFVHVILIIIFFISALTVNCFISIIYIIWSIYLEEENLLEYYTIITSRRYLKINIFRWADFAKFRYHISSQKQWYNQITSDKKVIQFFFIWISYWYSNIDISIRCNEWPNELNTSYNYECFEMDLLKE